MWRRRADVVTAMLGAMYASDDDPRVSCVEVSCILSIAYGFAFTDVARCRWAHLARARARSSSLFSQLAGTIPKWDHQTDPT